MPPKPFPESTSPWTVHEPSEFSVADSPENSAVPGDFSRSFRAAARGRERRTRPILIIVAAGERADGQKNDSHDYPPRQPGSQDPRLNGGLMRCREVVGGREQL